MDVGEALGAEPERVLHAGERREVADVEVAAQDDPGARDKQKAELELRARGQQRRYAWSYDEHYDIQEVDLDAGGYRNLTRTRGYDAEGSYSPDGSLIAFASNRDAYARPLLADLRELEQQSIDRYGRPLHAREVFEHLERVRQSANGRIGYLVTRV